MRTARNQAACLAAGEVWEGGAMLTFIVLGIIPGTSIQLTFVDVLLVGALLACLGSLYLLRSRIQRRQIQQLSISLTAL